MPSTRSPLRNSPRRSPQNRWRQLRTGLVPNRAQSREKPPVLIARVVIVTRSRVVMIPILWRFDCSTHDQAAPLLLVLTRENGRQQRDGSHLVQWFVAIAALGRLHARRAPFRALAGEDRVPCRGQPDPGRAEPSLGEPCASGMTVVEQ